MAKPLTVLMVEDSESDAELLAFELSQAGFELKWTRVETEADYLAELRKGPDIILSDYSMPQFSGLQAAELARKYNPDIPLILVSGTVGEDVAVEAMKRGATDYFLKDRITRLGQAVERAVTEARDRVKRRRAEEQISIQSHALEAAANAILITDPTGRILFANKAFCVLTGYSLEEIAGQTPRFLKSGAHDGHFYRDLWNTVNSGRVWQGELINRRKDGTHYFEEMTITPLRDGEGQITHFIAVKQDATERKKAEEARRKLEEEFRQSQKMEAFGQLAGGVAHDFNNILAVIQMQCDLMGEKELSEAQTECLREIAVASRRAAALTRQLLLFSRKEVLQPRDLDLNQCINDTMKMLRRIVGEDIDLQFRLASERLYIRADAGMIDQVVMNLVVNSRAAMPDGGKLVIETSAAALDEAAAAQIPGARPGFFACLRVSDTGCGIPPENLTRIFEPFFTTKEAGKGTGLGLATVFGIVQQHQGWIQVHSEPGQGAAFGIYFPRLAEAPDAHVPIQPPTGIAGGHETILLVEDDPFVRMAMREALVQLGYRVAEASSGANAMEVWAQHGDDIQLLLTDLVMPGGMNGKQLAERLRRENQGLKVVYASGYHSQLTNADFKLEEGVNYLVKPFEADKLAAVIRAQLDLPV